MNLNALPLLEAASIGTQFSQNLEELFASFQENAGRLLWNFCAVLLIFLGARLLLGLVSKGTRSVMRSKKYHATEGQGKRIDTMMTLTRSVARYAIYFIAILMAFAQLGFGSVLQNLLVTAGIGSLAIGIGAQSLVKDVATGFFLMFENQFSVGDYIKVDDAEGTVEATAMRVTYLRTFSGQQVILPNGSINRVVNYSRGGAVAVVVVSTAYESDTRAVIELIRQAAQDYAAAHPELVEDAPYVQGVVELAPSSVDVRLVCKTKPMKHWEVERGLRLAVKERFDSLGLAVSR